MGHHAPSPLAVVFDLDGTLIDSAGDIAQAVNDVLALLKRPTHSEAAIRKMIGHGARVLLEKALAPRTDLIEAARAHFKEAYRARLTERTKIYEGVQPMLDTLTTRGIRVALATNKPALFTAPLVKALDLDRWIEAWASGDEVPEKKPHPGVVQLALDRAQIQASPEQLAYVGDMTVDVETARRLGAQAWGAGWGYGGSALEQAAPDHIFATPNALHQHILQMLN